jgi:hypothetical protein
MLLTSWFLFWMRKLFTYAQTKAQAEACVVLSDS